MQSTFFQLSNADIPINAYLCGMSRYNHPQPKSWLTHVVEATIILAATALIVWFLPRGGRISYHFDENKPWPYGQFIAPFDIPIYKSEARLQAERDSLKGLFEPYFDWITTTEYEQRDAVRSQISKLDPSQLIGSVAKGKTANGRAKAQSVKPHLSGATVRTVMDEQLHYIYQQGVVSSADYDRMLADSTQKIRIINGITVTDQSLTELYTPKSGYERLTHTLDSLGISRQGIQRLNLSKFIVPNLTYNWQRSEEYREELNSSLLPTHGMVVAGQSIIDRGDIVTPEIIDILLSYERVKSERTGQDKNKEYLVLLGQVLYVLAIITCLFFYFRLFRNDYLNNLRTMLLITVLCVVFPLITSAMVRHTLLSVYIIPYAMVPVFVRVFLDSRTAFITHMSIVLLSAVALKYPFEFITTQFTAGLVTIYCLRELSERSQIIRTALLATLSAVVMYLGLELIHGKVLMDGDSVTKLDYTIYEHLAASGVLLTFAYPLMYGMEKLFGFVSNVTLVELSNINRDVLRRLSEVAPGTFQHSMQVSNLAAEVALRIGAKAQLVRTGALYHDIGKMNNPPFFTENQATGVNPHSQLTEEASARIIIRHITDGLILAEKYRLPQPIRDFIVTHHGCGLVKYFYIQAKNRHPEAEVDESLYRYPGPNPHTAEQAILMMADAVEASSRALQEYTEDSISQLVENIIDSQQAEGFFRECPLTFLDIQTAKEVFKEKLKTIYHTRIQYPTLQ